MSANLLHSYSRVQQLLVTLLFLPGISDSSKPIRHIAFGEQIAMRMRSSPFQKS